MCTLRIVRVCSERGRLGSAISCSYEGPSTVFGGEIMGLRIVQGRIGEQWNLVDEAVNRGTPEFISSCIFV